MIPEIRFYNYRSEIINFIKKIDKNIKIMNYDEIIKILSNNL